MKAVFASALVAAATALPWEDSQAPGYTQVIGLGKGFPSYDSGEHYAPDKSGNDSAENGGNAIPSIHLKPFPKWMWWRRNQWRLFSDGKYKRIVRTSGPMKWGDNGRTWDRNEFCSYFSVYRKTGQAGESALERNLGLCPDDDPDCGNNGGSANGNLVRGPNVDQWVDVESATKSTFCKACFGGDDVQTTARFCKSCFGGDVEVQTKFCKACFGGDDAETTARFCKACFGGDDAEVKARFCKSCFGGDDVETTARFCKACFGGDDAEVKARFCKSCFGGDDAQTTARFCKSCFGGDDAEVKARFCKSCFGGDDVTTTVAFCKACFGGDDAEVKARFCKSCFGGDVETHARFCKSCFGGDDAEVHSRFCKSCFGGDVQARVKCDCSNKESAGHYGIESGLTGDYASVWDHLKALMADNYSILAAAHVCGVDADACECALGGIGSDATTQAYIPGGALGYGQEVGYGAPSYGAQLNAYAYDMISF